MIKEVPVEVIKEVEKVVEVIKEIPLEVIKVVEKTVEKTEAVVEDDKEDDKKAVAEDDKKNDEKEIAKDDNKAVESKVDKMDDKKAVDEVKSPEFQQSRFPPTAYQLFVAVMFNKDPYLTDLGMFARSVSTEWSELNDGNRKSFVDSASELAQNWETNMNIWVKKNVEPKIFTCLEW